MGTVPSCCIPSFKPLFSHHLHTTRAQFSASLRGQAVRNQSRAEFNKFQEESFDKEWLQGHLEISTPQIEKRLDEIVQTCLPLPASPRVMDVGCGMGALIPHFQKNGIEDIFAVDLSQTALDGLKKRFLSPGTLGNNPGVRIWHGDFLDIPNYMGPVDVIFFNSVFGNFYSREDVLQKALSFLQPMGKIVVSHPLGKKWHEGLKARSTHVVPHSLPSHEAWIQMISTLPLEVKTFRNEPSLYITMLQIPERYEFNGSPTFLQGTVIKGKGLGSKALGVPTANLSPEQFFPVLKDYPEGVYFGWCKVFDEVYPAVLNLGYCPTVTDVQAVSLEAHILHKFSEDFWGADMKIALTGFLRPEIKFSNTTELLKQIEIDIGKAQKQLKTKEHLHIRNSMFFN